MGPDVAGGSALQISVRGMRMAVAAVGSRIVVVFRIYASMPFSLSDRAVRRWGFDEFPAVGREKRGPPLFDLSL